MRKFLFYLAIVAMIFHVVISVTTGDMAHLTTALWALVCVFCCIDYNSLEEHHELYVHMTEEFESKLAQSDIKNNSNYSNN